ncbi:MAG: hypothetical protein KF817_13585 [Phycisphaeraceae bacterium]|nr:hypothetical protein [Phycisphaeraceae bacterium]
MLPPVMLCAALATAATPPSAADLPIREVTIFKDGHVMVLRRGPLPVNAAGDVELETLPAPILGTFWAFAQTPGARLVSVRSGREPLVVPAEAGTLPELLHLAVGTDVTLLLADGASVRGTLTRLSGGLVTLRGDSTVAVQVSDVRRAEFHDPSVTERRVERTGSRDVMTLDLAWTTPRPAGTADVGMIAIERGLRWIPSYRVTLLSDDRAVIELAATLINELADLSDVTANLVIGVPTFMFAHTMDPMALQAQVARLGPYFDRDHAVTGAALSNAIMGQRARMSEVRGDQSHGGSAPIPPDLEVGVTGAAEDLYIFHVGGVSLRRGERLHVPIATAEIPYESVYTLTVPVAPPMDMWRHFGTDQQREIARQLDRPVATHVLRLTNATAHPFTTAPALIIRDGHPLAQGLLHYTARTATVDLEVTGAVDIRVESSERETGRTPDGLEWNGSVYAQVRLAGTTVLTNYKDRAVTVEVRRFVLGMATGAVPDGAIEGIDLFTGLDWDHPSFSWWRWYGWPWWWSRLNGASRVDWTVRLAPGERVSLECAWHYYWQ